MQRNFKMESALHRHTKHLLAPPSFTRTFLFDKLHFFRLEIELIGRQKKRRHRHTVGGQIFAAGVCVKSKARQDEKSTTDNRMYKNEFNYFSAVASQKKTARRYAVHCRSSSASSYSLLSHFRIEFPDNVEIGQGSC